MTRILISILLATLLLFSLKVILPEKEITDKEIENFWIKKALAGANYDIVIAGDSRIYRGVSPNALQQGFNDDIDVLNFGFSSTGFSDEYLDMAIEKFKADSKVNVLVMGVTPHSLTSEAFKNEHLHSFLGYSEIDNFKSKYLFSFLNFFSPYHLSDLEPVDEKNYQQDYRENGWIAAHYIVPDSSWALQSYKKTFTAYQVEQKNVVSFLNKVKKLIDQGITIVAFRPPSTVAMKVLEDEISGIDMNWMEKELTAIGVTWLSFEDDQYTSYDGSHLHYKAAEKLSKELGEKIKLIVGEL